MTMHEKLLPDTRITKHFKYKELNTRMAPCKDFVVQSLSQIALFLEVVRWTYGKPIKINSGFRSTQHNKEVGGVDNSMHLLGKAVDIAPIDINDYDDLCFHVARTSLPEKHYIRYYRDRYFIHIHFGDRDEEPLNLLPYFPFTKV